MNAGKAVYGILSTNAEVTAIVGTKIFPEVAEQETALPLIVYQLQSVAPEDTHDGPSKLDEVRFEFLCYADTYNGAADLGDKVRGALDRVSGTYNAVNVESVQFNDVDIDVIDAPRRYGQSLTFTFRIKRDDVEIAQGTPVTGAMLGDLYNVDVAGVTDNQILSYDAATGNWVPADDAGGLVDSVNGLTGTVILNFDDLNDVDTGTPSDGQLIAYQQGEWVTIDQDEIHIPINSVTGLQTELNTIPTDLNDLSDVSIVGTPTGNQALIYDATANAFKSQVSYTNRFEDEVETGKEMPTIFAERAYSVKSEGDGTFIDPESDTPAAGKVIVRKIYHKTGFITDADVIGDYTLIHTFADDTAYADTVATFEGFEDGATYGVPPFTLLQTWEEVAAAPAFTGLLNETYGSGAAAAYSTRRLNGNVTDCMVIRRASDSTTQTIGFDGSGNISEADIISFCTGTTCTVYQWLDQSGNGNTATAPSTGEEPTIYTGGALVKVNGKVALDTNDDHFLFNSTISFANDFTQFLVTKKDLTNNSGSEILSFGTAGTAVYAEGFGGGGLPVLKNTAGSQYVIHSSLNNNFAMTTADQQKLIFANRRGTTGASALDGGAEKTATASFTGTVSYESILGNTAGGFHSYDGFAQEAIFYADDKSSDRTSIESNVGDYFTQNTPLLDTYSGAAAAYSLRLLDSSYVGSAIRVRRSSDNTEQDIGFNVFGELDTVSLLAFAGTGDAFVKTWYDQSGNSNDATQTTTASQPQIVSSGAVIVENGKPAVEFDGSNDELPMSSTPLTSLTNYASFVARYTDTTVEGNLYGAVNGANNWAIGFNRGNANRYALRFYNGGHIQTGDNYDQAQALFTQTPTASTATVYKDGVLATQPYTARNGGGNVIGSKSGSYYFVGTIQEAIFYDSDQSTNRTNIESNIATFYDITL